MKRSLVKMGEHSLMSTIPKKWLDKNGLKQGDEINFSEVNNKLVISSSKEIFEKKAEITIDIPKIEITWRVIQPYYTSGYEELIINYNDKKTLELIEKHMTNLIGWEIVGVNDKKIIIKSISTANDDIEPLINRCWHIFKEIANISLKSFETQDKELIQTSIPLEYTINKYSMLIKRIINRTGYKYPHYTFMIVTYLELAANHFDYIRRIYERNPKEKINKLYAIEIKKLIELIEKTNKLYNKYDEEIFNWISLELPHFKWFEKMPETQVKYELKACAEYLVQISRQINAINLKTQII